MTGPRTSLAFGDRGHSSTTRSRSMNITSQRRINATLIGAYFASYLPELKAIDEQAFRGGRYMVSTGGLGVLGMFNRGSDC